MASKKRPTKECICGGDIVRVDLPPAVAAVSPDDHIWVHTETNSTHCYEDDSDAYAEPIDGSYGKVRW